MSRVIDARLYDQLTALRDKVAAAVADNNNDEMNRTVGMVQGFLLGLYRAGEIDEHDMQSLEIETLSSVYFLKNAARKDCNG